MDFMSDKIDMDSAKAREYEFLYHIRDQAMLYLYMSQSGLGYAEEILNMTDRMVEKLAGEIVGQE